jgi:hypothetical protein
VEKEVAVAVSSSLPPFFFVGTGETLERRERAWTLTQEMSEFFLFKIPHAVYYLWLRFHVLVIQIFLPSATHPHPILEVEARFKIFYTQSLSLSLSLSLSARV